jgi:hypothetical protein
MELMHSDLTKTFKGTWSVTLLGLNAQNNVTYSHNNSLSGKLLFQMTNPTLYWISLNSVATFEVKIILFSGSSICQKINVLSDLHRNYEEITRTSDIMIIAGDDNCNSILVHKAILTLRSPVFKG